MSHEMYELVTRQGKLIREQAKVIDSLFLLLMQHISADELQSVAEDLKDIAEKTDSIGGCEDDYS